MSETPDTPEARFAFGENWRRFLDVLDENRIQVAEASLTEMLPRASLAGLSFLDIGCGSGLFSLAAMRLGASQVHSFDYDPSSVACARELKRRYYPDDPRWTVERGDALDQDYMISLGSWDVVYSWGVLHHTGNMWQALANVADLAINDTILYISIYNDQGRASYGSTKVKQTYNAGPVGRAAVMGAFVPMFAARNLINDLLHRRSPLESYRSYYEQRGMSRVHDWVDWLGGYPFEVARPEEIFEFFQERGFQLVGLKTCGGGLGCNEFLLRKVAP